MSSIVTYFSACAVFVIAVGLSALESLATWPLV